MTKSRCVTVCIIAAACLAVVGLWCSVYSVRTLASKLPVPQHTTAAQWERLKRTPGNCTVLGTGSMAPLIPAGDPDSVVAVVSFSSTTYTKLQVGDLVVYRVGSAYIIHQLTNKTPQGWVAAGTHNSFYDKTPVTEENFVGHVSVLYLPPIQ